MEQRLFYASQQHSGKMGDADVGVVYTAKNNRIYRFGIHIKYGFGRAPQEAGVRT